MRGLLVGSLAAPAFAISTFGPNHCVSVSRSNAGSCVLRTSCQGYNLDDVEFAFTCQLPNMLQKHSFGKGGFDEVEEFDTNVKCNECGLPVEVGETLKKALLKKKVPKKEAPVVEEVATPQLVVADDPKDLITFGPKSCVSTWLLPDSTTPAPTTAAPAAESSEESTDAATSSLLLGGDGEAGTCIVKTHCSSVKLKEFTKYPIGLVCVSKDAVPVRHVFGEKSFDVNEQFNTLIRCSQCLGLDEVSESVSIEADVKNLSAAVGEIKTVVNELKDALPKPAAKEEKAAPAEEAAAASFLRKSHAHHKHHHKQVRYEDEDQDQSEDQDNNEDEPSYDDEEE